MKTLIKLPVKIILLPAVLTLSVISLLSKIAVNATMFIISPVICLCALFSVYCVFAHGILGFLIAISVSVIGFLALLTAMIAIDMVERFNARLIGILRS